MSANNLPAASDSSTALPPKTPADPYPPATAPAMRQFLKDLQLPPSLADEVDKSCRRRFFGRRRERREVEENIKLQYFFGGQDVAYVSTADGLVIVAAGDLESDSFGKALEALSADERRRVTLYSPGLWNDPDTTL